MCVICRWKGENVATTEVTEILGLVDFIQETNVYGVEVPGTVCEHTFLSEHCLLYSVVLFHLTQSWVSPAQRRISKTPSETLNWINSIDAKGALNIYPVLFQTVTFRQSRNKVICKNVNTPNQITRFLKFLGDKKYTSFIGHLNLVISLHSLILLECNFT